MSTIHTDPQQFQNRIVQNIQSEKQLQLVDADVLAAEDMGGLYTISGSSAATVTLPAASACAGSETIFKAASPDAHILSGTAIVFSDGGGGTDSAATLVFPAVVNSSAVVKSDGTRYLVTAQSGSLTYT